MSKLEKATPELKLVAYSGAGSCSSGITVTETVGDLQSLMLGKFTCKDAAIIDPGDDTQPALTDPALYAKDKSGPEPGYAGTSEREEKAKSR